MAEAFILNETFRFCAEDRAALVAAFGPCDEIERRVQMIESAASIYREMSPGGPLEPRQPQAVADELQGLADACQVVADRIDALSADAQFEADIKPHRTAPGLLEVIGGIQRAAFAARSQARRGPKVQYPERELAGALIDAWPEAAATLPYSRGSRFHTFAWLAFQLVGARPRSQIDGNLESILKPVIDRRRAAAPASLCLIGN